MKKIIILLFICISSLTFAHDKVNTALEKILKNTITVIADYKKEHKQISPSEIEVLIQNHFIPFIDQKLSAQQALKKHWNKLNDQQKTALGDYMIDSLIQNYVSILVNFNGFDKIQIAADPKIKAKGNKAIVKVNLKLPENNKSYSIIVKMVQNDTWKIYDIVFSGVSLVKSYAEQFNSYIKRRGFDKFIKKYLTPK